MHISEIRILTPMATPRNHCHYVFRKHLSLKEITKMKLRWLVSTALVLIFAQAGLLAHAQNVKITPIGSRTGDFCASDRAILFEDPTGVRILYDPGATVAGGTDARLGDVHVILLSHAHVDHIGNFKLNQDPDSDTAVCTGAFPKLPTTPNSNAAEIAAVKKSAVIASGSLASFIGLRIENILGPPTAGCPQTGLTNELTVPRTAPCTGGVGIGAKRTVRLASAEQGVQIAAVSAEHDNGLAPDFLTEPEKSNLANNRVNAYGGLANGFVVTFTNGLKVYLSGDTGVTSDMKTMVRGYYGANLAVFNIGDIFTTGPEEAAFALTKLIRPNGVIPSHANEVATSDGAVVDGTRTARFIELMGNIPVFVPLSGITMEFDGNGQSALGNRNQNRNQQ
jgi:L-ascorbate metabolism protein UlaG (beta-lactamase superfamily)